ncbi:MAG: flagellar hook-basal body protein [Hungatella sp.]
MNLSFYTASGAASAQQKKINVISNNFANINTTAYKSKTATFSDLMYQDVANAQGAHLQQGTGVKVSQTDTDFSGEGAIRETGGKLDFAIVGDGFFATQDPEAEETLYTRDGRFMMTSIDDTPYLTTADGRLVLNSDGEFIEMTDLDENATLEEMNIGVYKVPIQNGMMPAGSNNFRLLEKNGEAEALEDPRLHRQCLEASNVDMAQEMSQAIEAQRAYSYSLKMVQTSDEVEQEVNSLRR